MAERTEEEKDILKEIGNIGGGNALTSLSMMLDRPLDLGVPECQVVDRNDIGKLLKSPESLYAGVSMTMNGTIDCMLVLLMSKQFTKLVIDTLDSKDAEFNVESLTDMQRSALCEVGNIMGNSYITALGAMLDIRIDVSVPRIVVDDGHNVLKGLLEWRGSKLDRFLVINSAFKADDTMLESSMLLCPTDDSLSEILERLSF